MKTIIDNLINGYQKRFIPVRFIVENTRLIYGIVCETERQKITGLLTLVDFEKTFDTVQMNSIQNVLEIFIFCESIQKWINILCKDSHSSINQDGNFSFFEILAMAILNITQIKGIRLWYCGTYFLDDDYNTITQVTTPSIAST